VKKGKTNFLRKSTPFHGVSQHHFMERQKKCSEIGHLRGRSIPWNVSAKSDVPWNGAYIYIYQALRKILKNRLYSPKARRHRRGGRGRFNDPMWGQNPLKSLSKPLKHPGSPTIM